MDQAKRLLVSGVIAIGSLISLPHLAIRAQAVGSSEHLLEAVQAAQAAQAAHSVGDYSEAEQIWRQLLQQNPDNVSTIQALGITLSAQGRYEEAVTLYLKALEIAPDLNQAKSNLERVENFLQHSP